MRKFFVGLAAASVLVSGASMAGNDGFDDRIYGGILLNRIDTNKTDPNRQINDSRDGVKVLVGKQFTQHLGLEAFGSFNEFGQFGPNEPQLTKEASVGVDGLFYPLHGCPRVFKPFIKGGLGYTAYNSDGDGDLNANVGVGAFWKLNDRGVSIRTDAGGRYLFSDGSIQDTGDGVYELVLSAGITVPFGNAPKWADCPEYTGTPSVDKVMHLPEQGEKEGMAETAEAPAQKPAAEEAAEMPMTKDADGDGVADADDRCPGTPAGAKVDINGCPVPETVVIYFAFDSAELNAAAKAALDRVAANLNNKTFVVAIANGHADHTGTEEYNMGLSQRRANSVADYLKAKGVGGNMIRTRAYGESRPAADNSTPLGRAKNRRVEINLLRQ
ncbi:MAG: OmpA family protein [Phycisphaeraceae bacterium]|nr:OmpA family protein [Phycisphaeraceae bacterium]